MNENEIFEVKDAVAVYDAGENRPAGQPRYVFMVDIDPNKNGVIDTEERMQFMRYLSSEAHKQGAKEVVPHSLCVQVGDVELSNQIADDKVYTFNRGDVIYTAYTELPKELFVKMTEKGFVTYRQ